MDRARRLEYLQAIGIDAWVLRRATAQAALDATEASDTASHVDAMAEAGPTSASSQAHPGFLPPAPPATATPSNTAASSARATTSSPAHRGRAEAQPLSRGTTAPQSDLLSPDVEAQWDSLNAEVLSCTKCTLHTTRTQGVFGVGNRRADWLIIGEAPGAEEDRQGEPFVGRAGQLLNSMLRSLGLPRESVFIANVLKSRPPGNRDPKPDEVAACLPYLMRQIALLRPKLMLAVGRIAAQNLLATDVSLGRLRGQVHTFGELNTPLVVTYHPAYLLRTPADKRKAWEDLKFARSVFRRLASQES
jgi:DNA polymerase